MDADMMAQVLQELGLGEVPSILNETNKAAHQELVAKQLDIARLKADNGKVDDSIARLFGHVTNIKESLRETKLHNISSKESRSSEKDLHRVSQLMVERNNRDSRQLERVYNEFANKNDKLREDIATRSAINQLLEDEYKTDVDTVLKWTGDVDDYEEDITSILKFKYQDEVRIKEHHLKLEKLRQKSKQSKAHLDSASTDSRMAQLGLDKTAEEFRVLHQERQVAMEKWKEATKLISKRDEELQAIFNQVNEVKSNIRNQEVALQEQMTFLANEKDNITELEKNLAEQERNARKLNESLDLKEKELEEVDSEVTIEKRQIWRIGSEIQSKRSKLNQMKKELKKKLDRCEDISMELELARSKKLHFGSMAMTSEEKAKEMQRLLDKEEGQLNTVKFELDKLLVKKLAKEKMFKDIITKEEVNNLRLRALTLEIQNLSKRAKTTRNDLTKKEDIVIANNYTLTQIERELALLKGTQSESNRAKLKENIFQVKSDLENRLSDKRNLDHLVHKMASDVRKVRREIEAINTHHERIRVHLEEVTVTNETCEREHSKLEEKLEALLLEQKMLKLTERKAKENLEELNNEMLELKTQDLEVNEKLLEQRAETESQKEVYISQLRCLRDELATIRGEIRERKDRAEKLKIRYDLAVQALGDASKPDQSEKLNSHARHLVCIAQEKAELMEQTELLNQRIEKEEKELEGLDQAMNLLKNSNDQYRETNLRGSTKLDTEEIAALKDQVLMREGIIKQLKMKISVLKDDLQQSAYLIQKAEHEMSTLKRHKEDKNLELQQIEKDLYDQEQKYQRAEKVCLNLGKEMREKVTNANIFETEMSMRLEKEKQRAALIKLREISSIDPEFSRACQRELDNLGLSLPVATRIELMSATPQSFKSSVGNPRASVSTSRSINSTGSLFRHRSQSVGDKSTPARSTSHASVLVMELNESVCTPMHKPVKVHTHRGYN